MLVGNAGIVTVMSSLILTFILPETLASKLYGLLIVVVGVSLVWWAINSSWVDKALSKIINKLLKRYTSIDIQDFAAVLHLKDDYRISELKIDEGHWMTNRTLRELDLRHEGITVLGIDRNGFDYFGNPTGKFTILPEDVITVYGKSNIIRGLSQRKRNYKGDKEHEKSIDKEIERRKEEKQNELRNKKNIS